MNQTLRRKLAQRLAAARGLKGNVQHGGETTQPDATPPGCIPAAPCTDLPLSHAQERMWFLHQLDPAASAFNVCVLWHFHGLLDADALKMSALRIARRHSIFRTLYHTDDQGRARQRVVESLPPEWQQIDLRNEPVHERDERLQEIAQRASTAPFDLSCRSTLRLVLVRMNDSRHVLIMVGQHIVWDGPSFGIFSQELADGYHLYLNDTPDCHAPPAVQYVDFADWHRKQWQESSAHRSSTLSFWQTQLSPLPEPLDFPADFERSTGQDESGQWCTESLDENTTHTLIQLAAREQLTAFEVVIAAIAVLMARLARAPEVTIGTVASHRNLPELNNVIGNFGNVVPLRLKVRGVWSFRELLHHCAESCRAAFAHADVPFEYLLDHLQIPRGEARNPLLDAMVTFLSHGMEAPRMDSLEVNWTKFFNGTSQADLSFDALLQNGRLHLQATWRRSLYRPETIPAHLQRMVQLLRKCILSPDTPLAEHSLLLPQERHLLIERWGQRPALPTKAATMTEWFESTARQWPDATAICEVEAGSDNAGSKKKHSLSFADLNERANALARWLCAQQIGPESRVAVALSRRKEWFVAMLATIKAGAAFVPIDPNYPRDYIDRVLKLARPSLVFVENSEDFDLPATQARADAPCAERSADSLYIGLESAERLAQETGYATSAVHNLTNQERCHPLHSSHPLYLVFTSGSSGEPKGVVVTHSAMVNLLASHRADLYKEASTRTGREHLRVGHAWSLAFDAAWQPTLWMFEGHQLHLFDAQMMHDPIALASGIIRHRLDFIELTPGMLGEVLPWLKSGLSDTDGTKLPGHVPVVLGFGGESVKPALWEQILELKETVGFNLYGPTEATVDAMIARANAGDPPNIGHPVAGAQAYVLDDCLQLAPPGVPGELAIAGAGLARGYLTRGDLSASQFIANPHGAPGRKLYRTGDRVRWLPGGQLEYIGRIDEQVKIRGFRVEPMEVEASIEKMIQQPCAVVARQTGTGATQLLCFIETGLDDNLPQEPHSSQHGLESGAALQQRCAQSLPSHLVPTYFIHLKRLPRLPNGKIHRRALTLPEGLEQTPGRQPRTYLERQLCQMMAQVLGHESISIDDGFFELGGDSISVVKLVSLARREGLAITARQVFDNRCVARLASDLEEHGMAAPTPGNRAVGHDPNDTGQAWPTPLMTRYLSVDSPLQRFAQIASLALPPSIREQDIQTLLAVLLRRHAVLRSRLTGHSGDAPRLDIPEFEEPVSAYLGNARLLPSAEKCPEQNSLLDTGGEDRTAWPQWHAPKLARHLCEHLDPHTGHMIVAARVQDEDSDKCRLWLAIHHLVVDAASWHILAGDLALGWSALQRHEPVELPEVPTAWKSWSNALSHPQPNPGTTSAQDEHTLSNKPAPRGTLASINHKSWLLSEHQGQCPAALVARQLGFPLFCVLSALTALAALRAGLPRAQSEAEMNLCIERHGREASSPGQDLSRTVGWFARELPLHLKLPENDDRENREHNAHLIRLWCTAILHADEPTETANQGTRSNHGWQLGFNYLGHLATANQDELWAPQPQLDLLSSACSEHWPLLHDLDINAYYHSHDGVQTLRFEAIGPSKHPREHDLEALFQQLKHLIDSLSRTGNESRQGSDTLAVNHLQMAGNLKQVTPLQWEILQHCRGDTDPWTTQMELTLAFAPDDLTATERDQFAQTLRLSAARLMAQHEALRAGFSVETASTFVPEQLEPDWQSLDWRGETVERQHTLLKDLRQQWYQHHFQLDRPPLLRFLIVRLGEHQWRVLINCHHLLLDGWSVPRVLHEWLGTASGEPPSQTPPRLSWTQYLDWLHRQDSSAAWRYWNRSLQNLSAPSRLCPQRHRRVPSEQTTQQLSSQQSKALVEGARRVGIFPATVHQLTWARTLSEWIGQPDVVFGLFDSARQTPIEGLETLVGLVTQLVPLRIDTACAQTTSQQLQSLQARQFEWQTQAPVRLDSLDPYHRFGEFFDTLLVVENALDGDQEMAKPAGALAAVQEQTWHDSIGQAAGLFVYPGEAINLRLCYDPLALTSQAAQKLLRLFSAHQQQLIQELSAKHLSPGNASAEPEHSLDSLIPTETDDE